MKAKMQKYVAILGMMFIILFPVQAKISPQFITNSPQFVPDADNQVFRDEIINFIRASAMKNIDPVDVQQLKNLDSKWNNTYQATDWSIRITPYHLGKPIAIIHKHGPSLADVIKDAVAESLQQLPQDKLTQNQLPEYRFKVDFDYYPARLYSFIEYQKQGLELAGNRVVIRNLTTKDIETQIQASKAYLLKGMHPQWHGFFKFYDAENDKPEKKLRTIYSSSTLYTLLQLNAWQPDKKLEVLFKPIADFILSNQAAAGPVAGGFAYSFNPETKKRSCVYVVGTTSKTIFTLLVLNNLYPNNPRYLQAAKKGGDWLLKMVDEKGLVSPVMSCKKGENWQTNHKQSLLYSGQVLSALSRLYAQTQDKRYYNTALVIANHFITRVQKEGFLLGDEYRPANSISSSWVMMSLIDFAKINSEVVYKDTIQKIGQTILNRQILDKEDVYSNGRYLDAMTTSGNGWINEVFGVYYDFCTSHQQANCDKYRQAMVHSSRWLLQNAYTAENTFNVKDPTRAIGGFILNFTKPVVRTDAVCHGVNSLLSLLTIIGNQEQDLLNLSERPLREILPLLRAGNGFKDIL